MTVCIACNGEGWRKRIVPHPGVPGKSVTRTRVCDVCSGKGHVTIKYQTSGKDLAANESDAVR